MNLQAFQKEYAEYDALNFAIMDMTFSESGV